MSKYTELLSLYSSCEMTDNQAKTAAEKIVADAQKYNTPEILKKIFSCIDLTSLSNTDTETHIAQFAQKAIDLKKKYAEMPNVAALCVYPAMVKAAKDIVGNEIPVASVAAGFPSPQTFSEVKIAEAAMAVLEGADEVDMVFPLHHFLEKNYEKVEEEIAEVKSACRHAKLKVILETGSLTAEQVAQTAILSMASGADFVKTSTGKNGVGATPEAMYAMCSAVKEFNTENNVKIGIKAAGGISTPEDAVKYYAIVTNVLGEKYAQKETFRIGASRVANGLIAAVCGNDVKYF